MKNIFQETLANNLKLLRRNRNITQFELAELCETSTNYIALIETCKKFPSSDMLSKMVNALNIKPYELFLTEENTFDKNKISKKRLLNDIEKVIDKYI